MQSHGQPLQHGWITEWDYWVQAQGPPWPSPAKCHSKRHIPTMKTCKMTTKKHKTTTKTHKATAKRHKLTTKRRKTIERCVTTTKRHKAKKY